MTLAGHDKFNINSPIMEISSTDSNTKEVTLLVHKLSSANGNGLDFKKEYTEKYMNTLVDKPLVCSYYSVSDDLGTHEEIRNQQGQIVELRTIAIGTITDVWISDFESGSALYCKGTVWSYKYPQIMNCIEELFENDNASASVEVEILKYEDNPTQQYRCAKELQYLGLCLLGSTIRPADSDAGIISIFQKEVAELVEADLKNISSNNTISTKEGGTNVEELDNVEINNGKEIIFHIEANELSFDDIRSKLWSALNSEKDADGRTIYKYCIYEVFQTYAIVSDWDDDKCYKVNYSIENEEVTVDFDSLVEVEQVWVVKNPVVVNNEEELLEKITKLESEIATLGETVTTKETEISDLNTQIETLKSDISTKDQALEMSSAQANENIIKLGEVVDQLKNEIASLEPIKTEYEKVQAEIAEQELKTKRESLKSFALASKVISEKDLEEDEAVKTAITEVNENIIKSLIADRIVASAKLELNTSNTDVVVVVNEKEDLIPQTVLSKYGISK